MIRRVGWRGPGWAHSPRAPTAPRLADGRPGSRRHRTSPPPTGRPHRRRRAAPSWSSGAPAPGGAGPKTGGRWSASVSPCHRRRGTSTGASSASGSPSSSPPGSRNSSRSGGSCPRGPASGCSPTSTTASPSCASSTGPSRRWPRRRCWRPWFSTPWPPCTPAGTRTASSTAGPCGWASTAPSGSPAGARTRCSPPVPTTRSAGPTSGPPPGSWPRSPSRPAARPAR